MHSATRKSASSSRFWKWRSRSTKSASETEPAEASHGFPHLASSPLPLQQQQQSAYSEPHTQQGTSPYASESAHVLSLQHPPVGGRITCLSEKLLPNASSGTDSIREGACEPSPQGSVVRISVPSTSPISTSRESVRRFYIKAKKEIESRIKTKTDKEVTSASTP